jgi:hypothetical protein
MHRLYKTLCVILFCIGYSVAQGSTNSDTTGYITAQTSNAQGLLVQVSGGTPTNCSSTPYGWLLIPEANKSMVSLTLTAIAQNRQVKVFTNGIPQGQTFCPAIQVQLF